FDPNYRGQGIATRMIACALAHPAHQGLRRWMLSTRDAHGVYQKFGFESVPVPENLMVLQALQVSP
ncbi:N-acetyltransferase, partial [bacterium]